MKNLLALFALCLLSCSSNSSTGYGTTHWYEGTWQSESIQLTVYVEDGSIIVKHNLELLCNLPIKDGEGEIAGNNLVINFPRRNGKNIVGILFLTQELSWIYFGDDSLSVFKTDSNTARFVINIGTDNRLEWELGKMESYL